MVDYVARAMAQKALKSGGGGTSIDSYSREEIDAIIESFNEKIKELEEEMNNNFLIISD